MEKEKIFDQSTSLNERESRIAKIRSEVDAIVDYPSSSEPRYTDEKIRDTLVFLRALNLKTYGSCEGHYKEEVRNGPYIEFSDNQDGQNNKEIEKYLNSLLDKFYADRQRNPRTGLIVGYRPGELLVLESPFAMSNLLITKKDFDKMVSEMRDFTDFLKNGYDSGELIPFEKS